jgi:hypothetical protein
MMEKHPIENGAFRMTRTVDSRHVGNEESRNAPGRGSKPESRDSGKKWQEAHSKKRRKPSTFVDARSRKKNRWSGKEAFVPITNEGGGLLLGFLLLCF